jgi:serine protease Do
MKLFNREKERFISEVVILSVVFGFVAGVVGQIIADVYIDPWRDDYINQSLNTNQNVSRVVVPELKRVPKFLGIQQDFEVNKSVQKISPSIVGIYLKKATTDNLANQAYLPADLQANGFILTSDGWLVAYGKGINNTKKDQLVVIYNNKVYLVKEKVFDSTTGVIFLKIVANNLPVVPLGDSLELVNGQLVIALNDLGDVNVVNLKNIAYQSVLNFNNLINTSESYSKLFLLGNGLNTNYNGGPLVNLNGEVVGIIRDIDQKLGSVTVVPINQFRSVILDVLKNNKISRPFLGVSYIDLAWAVGLDQSITKGLTRGALIYQKPKDKTPAAAVGLLVNDIIISIDNQNINKNSSLVDLVQQYQDGDKVNLEIIRGDKTITKTITLASTAD